MSLDWWTLGIQFLNVAILVWLLARFFWKPVARMIEARRDLVAKTLTDAEDAAKKVAEERAEVARTREGFAAERDEILSRAREDARKEAAAVLTEARKEAARIRREAAEEAERARSTAEQAWEESATRLAVEIAGKLLAAGGGVGETDGFLQGVVDELSGLPERERVPGAGDRLRVTTATVLSPEKRAAATDRIRAAMGAPWELDFDTDPDLIAGVEVGGPSFTVRNSWRDTLAHIREELDHADAS
jgi:F-type H+-transporting ATPase subunit b